MPRRNSNAGVVDLGKRSIANAGLSHISEDDILRHVSLAYEDGYADAREFGKEGKFIPDHYSTEDRVKYLTGFKAGLRVNARRSVLYLT